MDFKSLKNVFFKEFYFLAEYFEATLLRQTHSML